MEHSKQTKPDNSKSTRQVSSPQNSPEQVRPANFSQIINEPEKHADFINQNQGEVYAYVARVFGNNNTAIQRFFDRAASSTQVLPAQEVEDDSSKTQEQASDTASDASRNDVNQQNNGIAALVQRAPAQNQTKDKEDEEEKSEDEPAAEEKAPEMAAAAPPAEGSEAPPNEGNGDSDGAGNNGEGAAPPPEQNENGESPASEKSEASGEAPAVEAKENAPKSETEQSEGKGEPASEGTASAAPSGSASSVELITPEPPSDHPEVAEGVATAKAQMGEKKEAETDLPSSDKNVGDARGSITQPTEELEGRGEGDLAEEIGGEPGPSPEILELCDKIRKSIKDKRPIDEDDLGKANPKDMADSAGHEVDSSIKGEVKDVQGEYDDLNKAETSEPTQETKPVEATPASKSTPNIEAEKAAPEPIPEEDLKLDDDVKHSEEQMEEAGMTTEPAMLVESGPIAEAREAHGEFQEFAETEPAKAAADQKAVTEEAKISLADLQKQSSERLEAAREKTTADTGTQQVDMKGSEEQMRAQVGQQAQAIFDSAQQDVQQILAPLQETAMQQWTDGIEGLSNNFESSLSRVDSWIQERHSDDIGGELTELWDDLTGLPDWITDEYDRAETAFGDGVCQLLTDISTYVNTEIARCQAIIQQARDEINQLYDSLPESLQEWAQEQKAGFDQRLNDLSAEAMAVQSSFNERISAEATQAVAAVQRRVQELREKAKGLLGRLADAVTAFLEDPARFIINGLLEIVGIAADAFWALVDKIGSAIDSIAEDPIGFANNLIDALAQGFEMFFGNIGTHLLDGMFAWLFSRLGSVGVTVPRDFSLQSVITFFLQVMGFSWEKIKEMITKHIGEENMEMIEQAWDMISNLIEMGPEGIFAMIQEQLDPQAIFDMILQTAIDYMMETLIGQVAVRLLGMLNPAGAIVQAIEAIYKVLSWLFENAAQIFSLIETIVNGISDIIAGNIGGMAAAIESALSGLLPVVIDFLADYLGLGDLPEKIADAIKGIQKKVEEVMEKAIGWIAEKAKAVMDKLGFGDKDEEEEAEDAPVGEENLDEEQKAGLAALERGSKDKRDNEGDIEKEEAEEVAKNTKEQHSNVFSNIKVVEGGDAYFYDYDLVQRGRKEAGGIDDDSIIDNLDPQSIAGKSPDDLLSEGWTEAPNFGPNRRTFQSPQGHIVYYDKGQDGATGWEGRNHWHVVNQNISDLSKKERNQVMFLDINGNPTRRGSNASHIPAASDLED